MSRGTHRLLVTFTADKGSIIAEFPAHLGPTPTSLQPWTDSLRHSLSRVHSWSVYTDASWRAIHPLPAPSVVGMQGTHEGRGALFVSADSPDWCSSITAVRFDIPSTLHALGGTAHVAEFLAIHTGLHLLHALNLRGTIYSDCLAAVKKINRRWTTGQAFQDAGATLITASRALRSDSITIQWIKGHPERSEIPPSSWTRQQWGIYVADALTKNWEIGTLPHSPVPFLRIHQIPFPALQATITPLGTWQWGSCRCSSARESPPHAQPSPGSCLQGEPRQNPSSAWGSSHLVQLSPSDELLQWDTPCPQNPINALRTYWDLRWHGENREVATRSRVPQVSACPICHRFWSQAHVLCDCPSTTSARTEGSLDLTITINRLPPGPMLELGRKFKSLLLIPNQPDLMARRWSGPWDPAAIEALRLEIANCKRKQIKVVLKHIGQLTNSTAASCWRDVTAWHASSPLPLPPPPHLAHSRMDKQQPSPGRGPRLSTVLPTPCFVRLLAI